MIDFNPETHTYSKDGVPVPGVTSQLELLGNGLEFVNPDILERAEKFGRAVHLACELWDKGKLNIEKLDPNLKPYLDSWITFCKEYKFEVIHNETMVYSSLYNYAGILDRAGKIIKTNALVDIKTTTNISKSVDVQLSGYRQAAKESLDFNARKMFCVQLTEDGYRVKECQDKLNVFLACLTVNNERKNG